MKKVMLIDDDGISNRISKNAIVNSYFTKEIIIKPNGKEALEYLRKECSSPDKLPDLILLDLKMPIMDAFKFLEEFEHMCKKVRKYIVIVALTRYCNADDIIKLRRLGKYYLVLKPLTEDKIMDLYLRFFRNDKVISKSQIQNVSQGFYMNRFEIDRNNF